MAGAVAVYDANGNCFGCGLPEHQLLYHRTPSSFNRYMKSMCSGYLMIRTLICRNILHILPNGNYPKICPLCHKFPKSYLMDATLDMEFRFIRDADINHPTPMQIAIAIIITDAMDYLANFGDMYFEQVIAHGIIYKIRHIVPEMDTPEYAEAIALINA